MQKFPRVKVEDNVGPNVMNITQKIIPKFVPKDTTTMLGAGSGNSNVIARVSIINNSEADTTSSTAN